MWCWNCAILPHTWLLSLCIYVCTGQTWISYTVTSWGYVLSTASTMSTSGPLVFYRPSHLNFTLTLSNKNKNCIRKFYISASDKQQIPPCIKVSGKRALLSLPLCLCSYWFSWLGVTGAAIISNPSMWVAIEVRKWGREKVLLKPAVHC